LSNELKRNGNEDRRTRVGATKKSRRGRPEKYQKMDDPPKQENHVNYSAGAFDISPAAAAARVSHDVSAKNKGTPGLHKARTAEPERITGGGLFAPHFFAYDDLKEAVQQTSDSSRSTHKDLLFGLFSHSMELTTEDRSKGTFHAQNSYLAQAKGNGEITEYEHERNKPSALKLSPLALIPAALKATGNFADIIAAESNASTAKRDFIEFDPKLKRSDYLSLALKDLEQMVMVGFSKSSVGIEADCDNSNFAYLTSKMSTQTAKTKTAFGSLPLAYNELSLAAFANWSTLGCHDKGDEEGSPFSQRVFPISTSLFHLCQVCQSWGHYEVECAYIPKSESILCETANILNDLTALREREERKESIRPSGSSEGRGGSKFCAFCHLEIEDAVNVVPCAYCSSMFHRNCADPPLGRLPDGGSWLCALCDDSTKADSGDDSLIDIEGCEGFVVESRKRPSGWELADDMLQRTNAGIDFNHRSWSRAICVASTKILCARSDRDTTEVDEEQNNASDLQGAHSDHDLAEGEICWAMRKHTAVGNPGRDEWWPAQVISLVTYAKAENYFGVTMTPYLVKFFGIPRASRVRASSTLPFFQNFREVGYKRVTCRMEKESLVDRRFRQGVEEAIGMMGFKTIAQFLEKADEIAQDSPGPSPSKKARFCSDSKGSRMERFKQDSFLIHARKAEPEEEEDEIKTENGSHEKITEVAQLFSESRLVGSVVAWMMPVETSSPTNVGIVLAIDLAKRIALVQSIPEWDRVLVAPSASSGVVVVDCDATSAIWKPMHSLHLISNGPTDAMKAELWERIISPLISDARETVSFRLESMSSESKTNVDDSSRTGDEKEVESAVIEGQLNGIVDSDDDKKPAATSVARATLVDGRRT
jgi:hypothetical protein